MGWILWTHHKNRAIKWSIPKPSSSFPLLHNAIKATRSWLEKLKTPVEKDRWKLCVTCAEGYRMPFEFVLRCWLTSGECDQTEGTNYIPNSNVVYTAWPTGSAKPSLWFREDSHTYLGRPNVTNSVTGASVIPCRGLSSLKGSLSLTGTWQKAQPPSTSEVSAVLLLTRKAFFFIFFFIFFHLKSCISLPGHVALRGAPISVFWKIQAPFGLSSPSPTCRHTWSKSCPSFLPPCGSTEWQLSCLWRTPCSPALTEAHLRLPHPDGQWPRNSVCPPNLLSLA